MAGIIYSEDYTVPYYQTNQLGEMTAPAVIQVLMELSTRQSHKIYEKNPEFMLPTHLTWILIQYVMNFDRMPRATERITLKTYATHIARIFTYRHFEIYDEEGHRIGHMESTWAVMDIDSRKIVRITDEMVNGYGDVEKIKRFIRYPNPTEIAAEIPKNRVSYRVRASDIDSNQHVNNTVYSEWALDSLGAKFLSNHTLKHFNVKFVKEAYYGTEITSESEVVILENGQKESRHHIFDEESRALASFIWEEIKKGP